MDSFNCLVEQLHGGDDQAARVIFERFAARLIGLTRHRISSGLRHKIDPEDVVQSAYRSFFRRNQTTPFELENWQSLWGLLSLITLRKCSKRIDYFRAQRRRAGREVSVDAGESADAWIPLVDREPAPEDATVLLETLEAVLHGFDPEDRQVIELSLQGYSTMEISQQLQRAERSVRRIRERVRQRLEQMMTADESG